MTEAYSELYRGFKIRILYDEDPEDPRSYMDCLTRLILFRRGQYNGYGDKHDYHAESYDSWEDLERGIEEAEGPFALCAPVYVYEHSGMTISLTPFSDPWDSGRFGLVFITKAAADREFPAGYTTEQLQAILDGEIDTYCHYIEGEVFGWAVADEFGEPLDSCWGYYEDYDGYPLQSAREAVDAEIEERAEGLSQLEQLVPVTL